MRKYAIVNNFIITEIKDLEDNECVEHSNNNQLVIDIQDIVPQPMVQWVLQGNKFEIPQGSSDREQFEIKLASQKTDFGIKLARTAVDRIGARNKILNKNGQQVGALLTSLMPVKLLLETGALSTARGACSQLVYVYGEYADILQYVIDEINSFEISSGL